MATPAGKSARGESRREERPNACIRADVKRILQHAADLRGVSLTDLVTNSVYEAARQAIEEHEVLRLTACDTAVFAQALLNPAEPSPALIALFRGEPDR